jgi:hypothetical protein
VAINYNQQNREDRLWDFERFLYLTTAFTATAQVACTPAAPGWVYLWNGASGSVAYIREILLNTDQPISWTLYYMNLFVAGTNSYGQALSLGGTHSGIQVFSGTTAAPTLVSLVGKGFTNGGDLVNLIPRTGVRLFSGNNGLVLLSNATAANMSVTFRWVEMSD